MPFFAERKIPEMLMEIPNVPKKKIMGNNSNVGGIPCMPDSNLYYESIVTKPAWHLYKHRHVNQWNRMEDPEISPQSYSHLILDKGANSMQWNENSLFNK